MIRLKPLTLNSLPRKRQQELISNLRNSTGEDFADYVLLASDFGTDGTLASSNYLSALLSGFAYNQKRIEIACTHLSPNYPIPAEFDTKTLPGGVDISLSALDALIGENVRQLAILRIDALFDFYTRVKLLRSRASVVLLYSGETPERAFERNGWGAQRQRRFFNFVSQNIDGIFVMTEMIRQYWISKGFSADRIFNTGPLVRAGAWQDLPASKVQNNVAMYFGNLSHQEVFDLIDVAKVVLKSIPSFKLRMHGDAPAERLAKFKEIAKHKGAEDCIEVYPAVPLCEMAALQQTASVLLMPSRDWHRANMGFPNKLGEYMMSGRPVVASRVDGISCWVSNEHVIFIPPGDVDAFALGIVEVLQNPSAYQSLANNAHEHIMHLADPVKNAVEMLNWVEEKVKRGRCSTYV